MIERRKRGSISEIKKEIQIKPKWKTDQMKRYGFSVKGTSISKISLTLIILIVKKEASKQSLILI